MNKKGFTLVELIVIVTMITAFALLMIPSVIEPIQSTSEATCIENQKAMMRDYYEAVATGSYTNETQRVALLNSIVQGYTNTCPKGGTINVLYAKPSGSPHYAYVTCSVHGSYKDK